MPISPRSSSAAIAEGQYTRSLRFGGAEHRVERGPRPGDVELRLRGDTAELVKQNVPTAEVRYFDGGHFVLDENADAIASAIIETFSR